MAPARLVHVIDDDDGVRDSLAFLLEAAGYQVRAYDSGQRFLDGFAGAQGCVLTDVRMPGLNGLELALRLKSLGSRLPIIVMTGHADVPLAVEAMKAGVDDFIEKPFDDQVIIASIEAAFERAEASHAHAGHSDDGERAETSRRLGTLSMRERQVLDALVNGKANKVMARDLGISPRTVEIYRANVMQKMGAANLSQLVRITILAALAH